MEGGGGRGGGVLFGEFQVGVIPQVVWESEIRQNVGKDSIFQLFFFFFFSGFLLFGGLNSK